MKPHSEVKFGAVYSRVSVDDNIEHGSPEQQVHMGHDLALRLSERTGVEHRIKYILTEERGISGGTTNRPQYQKLLDLIRSRKVDFITAKEISRLSRSTRDFCDLMELCQRNHVAVHIRGLDIDPNSPTGELMFKVLAIVAEFERKMISRRIRDSARSAMINNGKINGGAVPLGFDPHPEKKGYRIPNETELQQVAHLMTTFVETGSIRETLNEANRLGITNKRGGKFYPTPLKRLLTNPCYIGKMKVRYGDNDDQEKVVELPHGPVIPIDLFEAVKKRMLTTDQARKNLNRHGSRIYTLTGLLYSKAGNSFSGQSGTSRTGEKRYYYWNAKEKLRLDAPELEKAILTFLRKSFENNEALNQIVKELETSKVSKATFVCTQLNTLQSELDHLEKEEDQFLTIMKGQADQGGSAKALDWLESQIEKNAKEKKEIQDQLQELRREKEYLDNCDTSAKKTRTALQRIFETLSKANPAAQRGFFRQIFEKIEISKENKIKLVWGIPSTVTGEEKSASMNKWWANKTAPRTHVSSTAKWLTLLIFPQDRDSATKVSSKRNTSRKVSHQKKLRSSFFPPERLSYAFSKNIKFLSVLRTVENEVLSRLASV